MSIKPNFIISSSCSSEIISLLEWAPLRRMCPVSFLSNNNSCSSLRMKLITDLLEMATSFLMPFMVDDIFISSLFSMDLDNNLSKGYKKRATDV